MLGLETMILTFCWLQESVVATLIMDKGDILKTKHGYLLVEDTIIDKTTYINKKKLKITYKI